MTGIPYTNPISVVAEGLLKGLGIGGVIVGIIAAIGVALVVIGFIGYALLTVIEAVERAMAERAMAKRAMDKPAEVQEAEEPAQTAGRWPE